MTGQASIAMARSRFVSRSIAPLCILRLGKCGKNSLTLKKILQALPLYSTGRATFSLPVFHHRDWKVMNCDVSMSVRCCESPNKVRIDLIWDRAFATTCYCARACRFPVAPDLVRTKIATVGLRYWYCEQMVLNMKLLQKASNIWQQTNAIGFSTCEHNTVTRTPNLSQWETDLMGHFVNDSKRWH